MSWANISRLIACSTIRQVHGSKINTSANGAQSAGAGYEAVIAASGGGVFPQSIAYVNAAASVSVSDVTITEGDVGTLMTFTITRSGGTAEFYINYATSDGSATVADGDYSARFGLLHFDAGVNSQTITVGINGDLKHEPDQAFFFNISNATNGAVITDAQAVGTILNDDANHAPQVNLLSGDVSATAAQSIAVSSLFSGSDFDGDTLTYYLYDANASANSGHFVVNGVTVPAQTIYQVTAAQLAQATFVAGAGGSADDIYVQAYDGTAYSGWNTSVHVAVPGAVNHAPTVNRPAGANVTANAAQALNVSSLFSGSDVDGDAADLLPLRCQCRGQQRPLRAQWSVRAGEHHLSGHRGATGAGDFRRGRCRHRRRHLRPGLRRQRLLGLDHERSRHGGRRRQPRTDRQPPRRRRRHGERRSGTQRVQCCSAAAISTANSTDLLPLRRQYGGQQRPLLGQRSNRTGEHHLSSHRRATGAGHLRRGRCRHRRRHLRPGL